MRRFLVSTCVLMILASLAGCQTRIGCRDCGGLLNGVMGRPRVGLARSGGCETGACAGGGCLAGGRPGLFAPAQGFGNKGGCANGQCGHHAPDPAAGPPTGQYAYPYYTLRGPRDFLQNNPPSIGP